MSISCLDPSSSLAFSTPSSLSIIFRGIYPFTSVSSIDTNLGQRHFPHQHPHPTIPLWVPDFSQCWLYHWTSLAPRHNKRRSMTLDPSTLVFAIRPKILVYRPTARVIHLSIQRFMTLRHATSRTPRLMIPPWGVDSSNLDTQLRRLTSLDYCTLDSRQNDPRLIYLRHSGRNPWAPTIFLNFLGSLPWQTKASDRYSCFSTFFLRRSHRFWI